jgi:hypothetical protein
MASALSLTAEGPIRHALEPPQRILELTRVCLDYGDQASVVSHFTMFPRKD